MIRRFQIDCGFDLSITLDIDTTIVTQEHADSVATFWSSADEVADVSADTYEATARYAGCALLNYLMAGNNTYGALSELHEDEGWCWPGEFGINIVDHDLPDLSSESVECKELEVPRE